MSVMLKIVKGSEWICTFRIKKSDMFTVRPNNDLVSATFKLYRKDNGELLHTAVGTAGDNSLGEVIVNLTSAETDALYALKEHIDDRSEYRIVLKGILECIYSSEPSTVNAVVDNIIVEGE